MVDVDSAHHVLETVLNVLSISLNAFLLYLIIRHSKYGGKIYQVCLAVDAGLDFALGIACLVAQPVAFTGDGYLVMTSNAFSERRSLGSDTVALSAFYALFHVNVLWIPMQFAYRYIVICRLPGAEITKKACAVAVVGVAWNCIAFSVIFFMFSPPDDFQSRGLHVLQLNNWPYAAESPPPVFGSHLTNVRLIAWLLLWFTSSIAAAVVVVICEVKMFRFFREYGSTVSEHTRRLQKEFHRALLAMAICPLSTTGLPIFFFIITISLSLAPGPVSAFFTTAISSIAFFNPLTTIFFMRCYRDVVLGPFKKKHRRVTDSTAVAESKDATASSPATQSSA